MRRGKYERRRETDCRRGIETHIWRRRGTHQLEEARDTQLEE